MLSRIVDAVSSGASRLKLPPPLRMRFSRNDMYFPIQITGWGQPSGSPTIRSRMKPTSIAAVFHLKKVVNANNPF